MLDFPCNFQNEVKSVCQYDRVSNRNIEFLLCSLRDEPMQGELTESVPKWREIKINNEFWVLTHIESDRKGAK